MRQYEVDTDALAFSIIITGAMKQTLQVINEMQEAGVIGKFAIGGAVGATFYIEPAETHDVDVFISLEEQGESSFISLSPIYKFLEPKGYRAQHEYIVVEGWHVQFLYAPNKLYVEAINKAVEMSVSEVKTWVMTAEHLMAIGLDTGRSKDYIRLSQFLESGRYDHEVFVDIVKRHNLTKKWDDYQTKIGQLYDGNHEKGVIGQTGNA